MFRQTSQNLAIILSLLLFWGIAIFALWLLLTHPKTPLPPSWNPIAPFKVSDPVTPLTRFKLAEVASDEALCLAALSEARVSYRSLPPRVDSPVCGIEQRLVLSRLGQVELAPVETRCDVALRMAMWTYHDLGPAVQKHFGDTLGTIEHLSSYNCRAIRTPQGSGGQMSTHATAEAIDVTGFRLKNGAHVQLTRDWDGTGPAASFLKDARDGACRWFPTTLGPEFNTLHADHFHLQSRGRGTCR